MGMIQDNRMAYPPTLVDFQNVVGLSGQAHDNFPAPGEQARYDWMRLAIISLLSLQSSIHPPTQYRVGTLWYDRSGTFDVIKIWDGVTWANLGDHIQVGVDINGHPVTFTQLMVSVNAKLLAVQPRLTFSGYSINKNVVQIPVPQTIIDAIGSLASTVPPLLQPIVYINGLLVDPRNSSFVPTCPSLITLSGGVKLNVNDRFTVIIEHFDTSLPEDVIAS